MSIMVTKNGRTFNVETGTQRRRDTLQTLQYFANVISNGNSSDLEMEDWEDIAEASEILRLVKTRQMGRSDKRDEELYASWCEMRSYIEGLIHSGNFYDTENAKEIIKKAKGVE